MVSWLRVRDTSRSSARVTTPSVPSLPMNSCLRSYPALFLSMRLSEVSTVPSASTASIPKDQVAHHSVPQDAQAAGVGGDVAAHRRAVTRTQVEREHHAVFFGRALHLAELGSGLGAQRAPRHVDALDAVHGLQRQHDVACIGVGAIHETRESPVRDHGLPARVAQPEHRGNLLGIARPNQ